VSDGERKREVGLARALSKLGYCSRSRAAELIRAGRVRVNGKVCRDPEARTSEWSARIEVDEEVVRAQEKIYWMMNKPRGVVTTASDEKGRETVYTILEKGAEATQHNSQPRQISWVAPVGRLDKASEGLLLLTNDSEWAARVSAPETHLDKTYHVQLGLVVSEDFVSGLVGGVRVPDREVLRAKRVRRLRAGEKTCWLEIVLDEGRNRQIRRMMEAVNVEVLRLVRVAIGPLQLGKLAKGEHRALTAEEKRMIDFAMREKSS
jgi:23S rRNA pseudouridine2605 synthase